MNHEKAYIPEDFVIRIRPSLSPDGTQWTGEIDISIIASEDNNLGDEDYYQLMHFCKMIASTVPIMESDEKLRDKVNDFVIEHVDKEYIVALEEDQPRVVSEEGNIVRIDFSTRTKGNA